MREVGFARLRGWRQQKIGHYLRTFFGFGIDGNRHKVGVPQRSPAQLVAVDAVGQTFCGDFIRGFIRVERQRDQQLAVRHHLAYRIGALRELFASAPEVRVQRVEVAPQRYGGSRQCRCGDGFVQRRAVRVEFHQCLFDEG